MNLDFKINKPISRERIKSRKIKMKQSITYKELSLVKWVDAINLMLKIRRNWRKSHLVKFKCKYCGKEGFYTLRRRKRIYCSSNHRVYDCRKRNKKVVK